jgi:putative peptide zinc metalloprotease protein
MELPNMSTEAPPSAPARWRRVAGLDELGQAQGSGLRQPSYLVKRADGQVVQLSELLHVVVREVSADRDAVRVAEAVSAAYGRTLTVEGLTLLARKLEPLGLIEDVSAPPTRARARPPRANPLLSLRMQGTLLPARTTRVAARVMAPLFFPPVVIFALGGLVALDVTFIRQANLTDALGQVLATPVLLLALLAILTGGSLVHEVGHAAACHYGGAKPGVIGVGVYLVFPAYFTNVTDSYRLSRGGRVRTDLGGLYFNVWCLLALGGGYLISGSGLLLVAIIFMQLEMLQQLIPTVRFDGYYVLADLAGVPDLFARVRPVLLSLVPGRPTDPRVRELRTSARRIVTGWVVVVVPTLVFAFGWLIYNLPFLVQQTGSAIATQAQTVAKSWDAHEYAGAILAVVSTVLLVLPAVGLLLLARSAAILAFAIVARSVARWRARPNNATDGRSGSTPKPPATLTGADMTSNIQRDGEPATTPDTTREVEPPLEPARPPDSLTADAFTDEAMLRSRHGPPPENGWRRAVYAATSGAINPGPSAAERHRKAVLDRVTAPIIGTRRVVVMSRKGGVGKTTITLALGSTFATIRGDRVVALDANPDAGNLAHRVARPCSRTITDVLNEMELITSYSDLRRFTAQAPDSRLEVLASDDDPRIGLALNRQAYHRVIELLDHYYNLIVIDTGTGILDSANQGLLADADQLVLVLKPALDGARAAALTLDWLAEHGHGELVAQAVVVINGTRKGTGIPLDRVADHFSRRCAKVVTVPSDPSLESGAQTSLSAFRPATRDALVELAAAVADHFATRDVLRGFDVPRMES